MLLIFMSSFSFAEEGFYTRAGYILVTAVDMSMKTITYREDDNEITLKFNMELLENVYYKGTTENSNLDNIPLNKKYYVMIRYLNEKDFDSKPTKMLGEIYYIGTVKYPF